MEEDSGKRKRGSDRNHQQKRRHRQFGGGDQEQALPTPDDTTYRILCSVVKIGSVIGKGGSIIKSLRRETFARIKVLDTIPGVDERVILIWSTKQDDARKKQREDTKDVDSREDTEDSGLKRSYLPEGKVSLCAAQDALFKVHGKILEDEGNPWGNDGQSAKAVGPQEGDEVTVRLLVPNSQIGCLLGKGGKVIEKMRTDTGAQIRISSKDSLPGCALPTDELVQISGDLDVVNRAIYDISVQLFENPLRDRPHGSAAVVPPPLSPIGSRFREPMFSEPNMYPRVNPAYGEGNLEAPPIGGGAPMSGYGSMESRMPWPGNMHSVPMYPPSGLSHMQRQNAGREEDFSIRMLCPNDRMGMVIGKGGISIKQLRDATGARIKVDDAVPDADERIIAISALELIDERSPVIEAALKLQYKINDGGDKDGLLTSRLLVPSKQIGCLLGRRGSVITEMRKRTTAGIKVLQKVDLPKCAQDSDELVQVVGDGNVARQALIEVLCRLRSNVFGTELEDFGIADGSPRGSFNLPPRKGGFGAPPPSLANRHDAGFPAAPPPNLASKHDMGYPGGMHSYNGYGSQHGQLDSNYNAFPPPSALQGAASDYRGYPDFESNTYGSRLPAEGGGYDVSSINTSTKLVEMTIPCASISSVLGKGGSNLDSIRQISGAKLTILEPNPISGDRVAEIFGTPEQTQAAQSLLKAFIYSGQDTAETDTRGLY